MAGERRGHPVRVLVIFLLVIAALYGLLAGLKTWKPRLGLDLQGGTTITLTATNSTGGGSVDNTSLELARTIIQRRVDSMGVGEVSVTTAQTGSTKQIIVSAPGTQRDELVAMVGQTAQLQFRQVLASTQAAPTPTATASGSATAAPSGSASPAATPSVEASAAPSTQASAAPSSSATTEASGNRRPAPALPTAPSAAPAPATPRPTTGPTTPQDIQTSLNYQPTQQDATDFQNFTCGDPFPDVMDQPLIACDQGGTTKYFLGPVLVPGNTVKTASAGIPQGQLAWQVQLQFNAAGTKAFGDATTALAGKQQPENQLAIVLDGAVISAPTIDEPITGGDAQITGSFNQKSANDLANVLKYGALPLAFTVSSVDNVSPTLGSDQLRAGLLAGLIGLVLVLLYALIYYRALALAVVASLGMSAVITYAMLVLLGMIADYALSLAGIAGVIVAIGITADSFIIYFERIRDEVREGRSLRTAIETGWRKARGTIVVADAVTLLSSIVLYALAMGAVRGFAFTLGLTTLIDLAIVFFFTHPLVSVLGRTEFFGGGHRFSGLDPEHMGVERQVAVRRSAERSRADEAREARAKRRAEAAAKAAAAAKLAEADAEEESASDTQPESEATADGAVDEPTTGDHVTDAPADEEAAEDAAPAADTPRPRPVRGPKRSRRARAEAAESHDDETEA